MNSSASSPADIAGQITDEMDDTEDEILVLSGLIQQAERQGADTTDMQAELAALHAVAGIDPDAL
jgi:hypothetical protein